MKSFSSLITAVLATLLVIILLGAGLPGIPAQASSQAGQTPDTSAAAAAQPACDTSRSVQVSGTAVINVTPDRALIQLGVQSNGATPQAVEEVNTAATQSVIKAVRAMGIESKDIATDRFVIEPIYDNYSSLYVKGYRIQNTIAITLRDVRKTSPMISAALQAGANQVVNIDFYTSELRQYRDQARELATQAAREKAQALASAAGAEAGCVLTIQENSWSYYNGSWYGLGSNQSQWTQNVIQNIAPGPGANSGSGDEPISLGQISVKAEITASFSLK